MSVPAPRKRPLRDRTGGEAGQVTNGELFFDLVYVFAFTQLSQLLYAHLGWLGAGETTVIFVALWWAWSYTAWATGWIDPERLVVLALLAVLMLGGLVMAASILEAFTHRGWAFAIAYVAVQLLRSGFVLWASGLRDTTGRNYGRLLAWSAFSGLLWVLGGVAHHPEGRLLLWSLAAAIDLLAPLLGFRLPGAGVARMSEWTVAGGHFAERCQLLLMIAFGESFLRLGEAWAHRHGTIGSDAAFAVGFVLVIALWSVYFLHHADVGARLLEQAGENAAGLARSAYLYAHAAMVGGVIVLAVAIHLTIEAPGAPASTSFAVICVGGPALVLAGLGLSKRWLGHGRHRWPAAGVAALAFAGAAGSVAGRLPALAAVTVVAVAVAVWVWRGDRPT